MFRYAGDIRYVCDGCGIGGNINVKDFEVVGLGSSNRKMGAENIDSLEYVFNCPECDNEISLIFELSEYPVGVLSHTVNRSSGASIDGEPYFEYLPEDQSDDDNEWAD